MTYDEIKDYIFSQPNSMAVMCKTCGQNYGMHHGLNCDTMSGSFYPVMDELPKSDPNTQFKKEKGKF